MTKQYKPKTFDGVVWYDRSLRLWTCVAWDEYGGPADGAGYGLSKDEAENDCEYQQRIKTSYCHEEH